MRRIVHAADATGKAIHEALLERRCGAHPNITAARALDGAIDARSRSRPAACRRRAARRPARCHGVYALDIDRQRVETLPAPRTSCWPPAAPARSTSTRPIPTPPPATASRWPGAPAAASANMEFIQFHPTCLYHPQARKLPDHRGGARRRRPAEAAAEAGAPTARASCRRTTTAAELAPRDIVARAIDFEMKKHGLDYVWLDITQLGRRLPEGALPDHLRALPRTRHRHHARSRSRWCRRRTTPAAASSPTCTAAPTCPGCTRSARPTYTGLHGANRLASNSLLECVVLGRTCAARHPGDAGAAGRRRCRPGTRARSTNADEQVVIAHNWDELRRFMWNYVGIVRTTKRLERALHRIELLQRARSTSTTRNFRVTRDLLELRNLVDVRRADRALAR